MAGTNATPGAAGQASGPVMEPSGALRWHCCAFSELSVTTLHHLLKLRQEVFIIEQMCPYPDLDGRDPECLHVYGEDEVGVLAYLRVVPAHCSEFGVPSLGRVCTAQRARSGGYGRELVARGLAALARAHPGQECVIGAQAYLQRFYESCGFVAFDAPYVEDGIPHIHMRRLADR